LSADPNYYCPNLNCDDYQNVSLVETEKEAGKIEAFLKKPLPHVERVSYQDVIDALIARGFDVYIKGGVIRDLLSMNSIDPKDVDIDFTGTMEELIEILEANRWTYTHIPGRYALIIGDYQSIFIDAVPTGHTPYLDRINSISEFTINNIFYHCNTQGFLEGFDTGLRDLRDDRLQIIAKDWRLWLYGTDPDPGRRYYKIFRFWKMVGKGYVYSTEMSQFFLDEIDNILKQDQEQFIKELVVYLSSHYKSFDEVYRGCLAIMGNDWTYNNLLSLKDEINREHRQKEKLLAAYTHFPNNLWD